MVFAICGVMACLVLAGIFMYFRVSERGPLAVVSKILASLVFVLTGMFLASRSGDGVRVLILFPLGLLCGMIGDILLELKVVYPIDKKIYYYGGCVAFALGHVFYICGLCMVAGGNTKLFNILCFAVAIGLGISTIIMMLSDKLKLNFGEYFWISYVYCFVLATMVAFSVWLAFINIKFIPIMIGMVLFFVSDLVLSMQYFGGSNLENRPSLVVLNHTLYYLAQCAVVIALLFL